MLNDREVQIVADIRDIALTLIRMMDHSPHKAHATRAMVAIEKACAGVIRAEDRKYHHILEDCGRASVQFDAAALRLAEERIGR